MAKQSLLILIVGLALAAGGIAFASGGEDVECCASPDSRPENIVTYESGGGFAPSFTRIEIGTDGVATVEQGNDPDDMRMRKIKLDDDDVDDLRETLIDNPIDEFGDPETGDTCFDCFGYTISFQGDTHEWDSGSPFSQSRTDVVEAITQLPLDLRQGQ